MAVAVFQLLVVVECFQLRNLNLAQNELDFPKLLVILEITT